MLLMDDQEDFKPEYKSLFLPIGVYQKLKSKKKPSETIIDMINRLLEKDEESLEQLYQEDQFLKNHRLKSQQFGDNYGPFGKGQVV